MRVPYLVASFLVGSAIALAAQTPPPQQQGQQQGRGGQAGRGGRQGGNQQQPARDNTNQTPAPVGTGTIGGTIVSTDGGRPVRRARVTLTGGDLRSAKTATSDDRGRFSFAELPAGRFTLSASKAGYVNIMYGQKKPGRAGTPIQLADGQHLDDLKLPLPKGGVLTGMVLDENNEPSTGTQVSAWRAEMRTGEKRYVQAGSDQTDDRGAYRIYGLLPGDYLIRATPRNSMGDLRQAVQDVVGQVLDQSGRGGGPGAGGRGGLGANLPAGAAGGLQQLLGGRGAGAAALGGLLGDANNGDDTGTGYAPVYYPGTTTSTNATAVALDISQERQGVDFQLQLVQTAKISGTVTSPDGDTSGVLLTLVNETERAIGGGLNTARVGADGSFSFTNVAPGQYMIQARQGRRGGGGGGRRGQGGAAAAGAAGSAQPAQPVQPEILWAETPVFVQGNAVNGVTVSMQAGMKVSGHLVFEGAAPPTDLTRVRVGLMSATQGQGLDLGQNMPATLDASGNFTITGVAPGRYTVRVQGQIQGMTLKSAVTGGRDILDFPLEVRANSDVAGLTLTLANQVQELSGTLTDSQNMPATEYTVIVFSTDTRFWTPQSRRILSSRPGTDGRFIVRNLPAGDYHVAAVTDVEPGEWFDPKFLEQLRAASARVTLAPGDKKVQDLRLGGGGV